MANTANIIINLDDAQAVQQLQKLAASFTNVGASATQAGQAAQSINQVGTNAKKAATNSKQLDSALNSFGAKFITMELGKKVAQFADATLTAAASNEKLSEQTRQTAKSYIEVKENVAQIGEGMVLAVANIGAGMGKYAGLAKLIKDTAEYWQASINGDKSAEAIKQEEALAEATKKLDEKKKKLKEKNDKKENDDDAQAKAKAKAKAEAEYEQLKVHAANIKENVKTESQVIEDSYNDEVTIADKAYKKKLISAEQYEAQKSKLIEKHNAELRAMELEQEEPATDPATDAYEIALKEADARNAAKRESDAESTSATLKSMQTQNAKIKQMDADLHASRMENIDSFLNGNIQLFGVLAQQNKKYAVAAKTVSIAQALINTYEAATKAWAQGGIFGAIGAAGAIAGGMASVAQIRAQKFANGGVVQGISDIGDRIPVAVNSGEMILNKSQQAELFKIANNQSVNQSQPINISFNVGSGLHATDIKKLLTENKSEFTRFISQAVNSRSLNNQQVMI